jgi:hypothetical protein
MCTYTIAKLQHEGLYPKIKNDNYYLTQNHENGLISHKYGITVSPIFKIGGRTCTFYPILRTPGARAAQYGLNSTRSDFKKKEGGGGK